MKEPSSLSFYKISFNTFLLSFLFVLISFLQLGFFILLTHILKQDHVKLYELGRTCLEIGAGIAGPGFIALIIREASRDYSWWMINRQNLERLITICSSFVSILLILTLLISLDSLLDKWVIFFFCLSIIFLNRSNLYDAILQARENFALYTKINIIFSITFIVLSVLSLWLGPYAIVCIALLMFIRWIVQSIVMASLTTAVSGTNNQVSEIQQASIKGLIYGIFPLMIGSISFILYSRIDVLMLEWMGHGEQIALYGAAFRPIGFLTALFVTFYQALAPSLSRFIKEDVNKSFNFIVKCGLLFGALGLAISFILNTYKTSIISLLYPASFISSQDAFHALLWTLPIIFLGNAYGNYLVYNQKDGPKFYALISIIGLLINITGNLYAIPIYKYIGAAWVTLITDLITTLIMIGAAFWIVYKNNKI